jgi:hypothetical protein
VYFLALLLVFGPFTTKKGSVSFFALTQTPEMLTLRLPI